MSPSLTSLVMALILTGASAIQGSPHVIGVQTTSGEIMHADLVVDAMGRRSHAGEWI